MRFLEKPVCRPLVAERRIDADYLQIEKPELGMFAE
jgi:hypothetical protein